MHILDKIVSYKKQEIARLKQCLSVADLTFSPHYERDCNSYTSKLDTEGEYGIIAEFKRKSPSKSAINLNADLLNITRGYQEGGAAAISILTDEHFFGGQDSFLTKVRRSLPQMPLLRKEFIIDDYQIHQAKALGADIILLIAEILTQEETLQFAKTARDLGMEVLLEMHSEAQLKKYNPYVSIVGVNNRDLTTFYVDYDRSKKLYDQLPAHVPKIAESGLSDPRTCHMLYQHGFRGFLIGENFMKKEDPGATCASFISVLKGMS